MFNFWRCVSKSAEYLPKLVLRCKHVYRVKSVAWTYTDQHRWQNNSCNRHKQKAVAWLLTLMRQARISPCALPSTNKQQQIFSDKPQNRLRMNALQVVQVLKMTPQNRSQQLQIHGLKNCQKLDNEIWHDYRLESR